MDKKLELSLRILNVESLPSPPQVIAKLIEIFPEYEGDIDELEKTISVDPGITAQVLRIANSAYFGFSGRISTVSKAILLLGPKEVWNIALGVALQQQFSKISFSPSFNLEQFWLHSFFTGIIEDYMARGIGDASEPFHDAMSFGLLHDIGRLIMASYYMDEYEQIQSLIKREGLSAIEAESRVGLLHTEVGKWLVRKWQLPKDLEKAVAEHHFVPSGSGPLSFKGVFTGIANLVSKTALGREDSDSLEEELEAIRNQYPWTKKILNNTIDNVDMLLGKAEDVLKMISGG
ncbi:HDOD domain-containing protein [Dissulfuribacter thermophilus]|uniref:HDOD domain-containing protein n=1 Tax=Dissulfuribacter thermophilus TaxID=1156395 RepID=UPI000831469B|nr:HDOD domain-containing protein [Dissulfuribacter thermophilus]